MKDFDVVLKDFMKSLVLMRMRQLILRTKIS